MEWLLNILITHKRMRGLSESQLQDLIRSVDDIEALRIIKEHLEKGDFRFAHIETAAPAMIEACTEKAKELLWKRYEDEMKRQFLANIGDPFAGVLQHAAHHSS